MCMSRSWIDVSILYIFMAIVVVSPMHLCWLVQSSFIYLFFYFFKESQANELTAARNDALAQRVKADKAVEDLESLRSSLYALKVNCLCFHQLPRAKQFHYLTRFLTVTYGYVVK